MAGLHGVAAALALGLLALTAAAPMGPEDDFCTAGVPGCGSEDLTEEEALSLIQLTQFREQASEEGAEDMKPGAKAWRKRHKAWGSAKHYVNRHDAGAVKPKTQKEPTISRAELARLKNEMEASMEFQKEKAVKDKEEQEFQQVVQSKMQQQAELEHQVKEKIAKEERNEKARLDAEEQKMQQKREKDERALSLEKERLDRKMQEVETMAHEAEERMKAAEVATKFNEARKKKYEEEEKKRQAEEEKRQVKKFQEEKQRRAEEAKKSQAPKPNAKDVASLLQGVSAEAETTTLVLR